ncbi:MAG: phosphoribosylaminoimidazolesuccinocarboxamide synthase [Gemmobacter sp.]
MPDPTRLLPEAAIPELPGAHRGKVRDSYDLPDGTRLLIATDRLSAFDRALAVIPWKGQVLTQTARFWFAATADICPNHVIGYPDPNVLHARRVSVLPVEVVVRGYLAGTTSTSILTMYRDGARMVYGHRLPDGLRANEALPRPIVTPTTKAADGGHDMPLTAAEIVARGLVPASVWAQVEAIALALFERGQAMASARGLILADTKYEFGTLPDGTLLLADELHTPDSARWWIADGYAAALAAGTRPPSFDKDVIRSWVAARGDPYRDPLPEIPPDMIAETSRTYVAAFEAITGQTFVPDMRGATPLDRIRANLAPFFGPGAGRG